MSRRRVSFPSIRAAREREAPTLVPVVTGMWRAFVRTARTCVPAAAPSFVRVTLMNVSIVDDTAAPRPWCIDGADACFDSVDKTLLANVLYLHEYRERRHPEPEWIAYDDDDDDDANDMDADAYLPFAADEEAAARVHFLLWQAVHGGAAALEQLGATLAFDVYTRDGRVYRAGALGYDEVLRKHL